MSREILGQKVEVSRFKIGDEPYIFRTPLKGLLLIRRPSFRDDRGILQEDFLLPDIEEEIGREVCIGKAIGSLSYPKVLRGIHAEPHDKIVTPYVGSLIACLVDLRPDSETFKKWIMIEFSKPKNHIPRTSIFIPKGFGNSFYVCGSEPVDYRYTVEPKKYDSKTLDMGVIWNDPELAITWPNPRPILSNKDQNLPTLEEFIKKHRG